MASLLSHIHDTNNAFHLFNSYSFPPGLSKLIFTFDVNNLYTVIPDNEGLLALKHFLDLRSNSLPDTSALLRQAEFVIVCGRFLPTDLGSDHGNKNGFQISELVRWLR